MSAWYPNAGIDVVRGNQLTLNGTGYSVSAGKLVYTGATSDTNWAGLAAPAPGMSPKDAVASVTVT